MKGFLLAFGLILLWYWIRRLIRRNEQPPMIIEGPMAPPIPQLPANASDQEVMEHALETKLQAAYLEANHPEVVLESEAFRDACLKLSADTFANDLKSWIINDRRMIHMAAVDTLIRCEGSAILTTIFTSWGNYSPWSRYIALRLIDQLEDSPPVHEVLVQLDRSWLGEFELRGLREWVALRIQNGETVPEAEEFDPWFRSLSDQQSDMVRHLLWELGPAVGRPWLSAISESEGSSGAQGIDTPSTPTMPTPHDKNPLTSCGRLWQTREASSLEPAVSFTAFDETRERIQNLLSEANPRPIVLVGPPRTGKTRLVREVMRHFLERKWRVLEASPDQMNAGMSYVGELEARVRMLSKAIVPSEKCLWYVPEFGGLLWAGSMTGDPTRSIARMLRHDFESRRVVMLGECTRAEWEKARLASPWLESACEVVQAPVPDDTTTRTMVRSWLESQPGDTPLFDGLLLREAWELTAQFLDENQRPGNLFDTVRRAIEDRNRDHGHLIGQPLTRDDLLRSVSRRTGLSLDLLDDRRSLDLNRLESFFRNRIFGQNEAVTCLVERLAMIKAGLTDPTRPLGVFLFAGPTGTGKTELAKVLATWLFGSPSRLVRLDMSELQDASALDRLLGTGPGNEPIGGHEALVDAIRREPHSVVLLDEFEKANSHVWDLFLQVFDDGRLSDRRGRTADFRHCVVLLTSNLGSVIHTRPDVGFGSEAAGFRASKVQEALQKTFRPEFLNRLDQIVVFQPLSRDIMRTVLRRQLDATSQRRGLRQRPWAMEWDASALELLLDKGFSAELGARPLQRAIEKHLLAPLAKTIAAQQAPEGDQFLFVRAEEGKLVIDFVDPDAPSRTEAAIGAEPHRGPMRIALESRGTAAELASLEARLTELEAIVESDAWAHSRDVELEMTSLPDFWESSERFEVLDLFQTRERVERMLGTCRSLHFRLAKPGRDHVPPDLLRQLALRLHVVGVALEDIEQRRPREAVVVVQAERLAQPATVEGRAFAKRLAAMYREWAKRRGATLKELNVGGGWAAQVQGFGSWTLLHPEHGLHILETPDEASAREARHTVRVHVVAVPPHAPEENLAKLLATRALRDTEDPAARTVVRRYREEPSPLIRDAVRGWRTGRSERVFAGDFDLLEDDAAAAERS